MRHSLRDWMDDRERMMRAAATPLPTKPAADEEDDNPSDSKGKHSPAAEHVANYLHDPVGTTKDAFDNVNQKKMEYELAVHQMAREHAPVKAVLQQVENLHGIPSAANVPFGSNNPDPSLGYEEDPNATAQPGQTPGMNPGNASMPPGMKPGMPMPQGGPPQVGNQPMPGKPNPAIAPGRPPLPGQAVRPNPMGQAAPGGPNNPGNPAMTQQQVPGRPIAPKPPGAGKMPGTGGPGGAKTQGKIAKAQKESNRAIKVHVTANSAAPPVRGCNTGRRQMESQAAIANMTSHHKD